MGISNAHSLEHSTIMDLAGFHEGGDCFPVLRPSMQGKAAEARLNAADVTVTLSRQGSQMPHQAIIGMHEWVGELITALS